MASDLSSGCTDDIEIFDEKEEGEISLEDVSSSEESHPNYRSGFSSSGRCTSCMSMQQCASWCSTSKNLQRKTPRKQDGAHGKENRRYVKDSSGTIGKHVASTLQEKNDDDLVPISSDSDMEIVGLPGNSKHVTARSSTKSSKVRKKKKKKRSHASASRVEDPLTDVDSYGINSETATLKSLHSSSSHHRDSSPRYSVVSSSHVDRPLGRSPPRRRRATRAQKSHSPLRAQKTHSPQPLRPQKSRSPLRAQRAHSPLRTQKPRSPIRRSRSPATGHHGNSSDKKVSRKLPRSPRRSSSRSPVHLPLPRESRDATSSQTYVDMYATKLLKKVRRLESVGNSSPGDNKSRSKEHSSLREKLSNMMKEETASSRTEKRNVRNGTNMKKHDNNNVVATVTVEDDDDGGDDDEDDDDDIELLRRLALETKQKKAEIKEPEDWKEDKGGEIVTIDSNLSDDTDSEALELRMIALHSAVMKKHQHRVERGVKSKRRLNETRNESPFGHSFLDNIPIPDELYDIEPISPTTKSPIREDGTTNPEDMELDTDVEREKEKDDSMPYSPTDDFTSQQNLDTELLGVELNDMIDKETRGQPNRSFASESLNRNGSSNSFYRAGIDTPYSPSVPTETPKVVKILTSVNAKATPSNEMERPLSPERSGYTSADSLANYMEDPDAPYSPSKPVQVSKIEDFLSPLKNASNTETPYSPTDTPIYDPELTGFSLGLGIERSTLDGLKLSLDKTMENAEWRMDTASSKVNRNLVPTVLNFSACESDAEISRGNDTTDVAGSFSRIEKNLIEPSINLEERRKSFDDAMDKLPDVDLDGSPLVPLSKDSQTVDILIPLAAASETIEEPLYLHGLPDVTKDTNKIPTLVNRTLVPVPILKTNKQLQQPLPQKKIDVHVEPSFKSAKMNPVSVGDAVKPTAQFKPIKLYPVAKKTQLITMTRAAAFNSSFGDDSVNDSATNEDSPIAQTSEIQKYTLEKAESEANTKMINTSSLMLEKVQEHEKSRKTLRQSTRKSPNTSDRSESSSPVREGVTTAGKGKEKVGTRFASKQAKLTKMQSSTTGKQISRKKRSNDKSSTTGSSSPRGDSTPVTNRKTSDTSNATTGSKKIRKKSTSRAERKTRQSEQRARNQTPKKSTSTLKNSRRDSRNDNAKESTDEKMRKSVERKEREASEERNAMVVEGGTDVPKKAEASKSNDETERKRRCSLDEDEEALRALLLASLPKRTKPTETGTLPTTNTNVQVPRLTDTTVEKQEKIPTETPVEINDSPIITAGKIFVPLNSASVIPKIETAIDISTNIQTAKVLPIESNASDITAPFSAQRKRPGAPIMKNPPKKIVKKALPVSVSTKVVNNAKKYQNAMVQKKLNLQRAASLYSAASGSRNITLNNLKINETARPSSPKITTASKTQRLVINLESDTDSETELPKNQNSRAALMTSDHTTFETRKPLAIPTTDFEKSVVKFLKDQRKKLESVAITKVPTSPMTTISVSKSLVASTSAGKLSGVYSTPLAVRRHLPVSQQEEYRRLKQQIMERESKMLQKNGSISQSPCTPPGPLSPASPIVTPSSSTSQTTRSPNTIGAMAGTILPTDKCPEKVNDENESKINVSNQPKKIVPSVPVKTIVKPAPTMSKVKSTISNNPTGTSTPKTSGAMVQSLTIINTSCKRIPSKTSLPSAKSNVAAITENRNDTGKTWLPSISTQLPVESSTSFSTIGKPSRILGSVTTLSQPNVTAGSPVSLRPSLGSTEMLTIQIPNDKILSNRATLTSLPARSGNGKGNGIATNSVKSSCPLRILGNEQLNNRLVKIQVERGREGRRVTVGSKTSPDHLSSRMAGSSVSRIVSGFGDNETEETIYCDNSNLSVNESNEARIIASSRMIEDDKTKKNESVIAESDASTLLNLSKNMNDSAASTLILARDDSGIPENLESTRSEISGNSSSPLTEATTKHSKIQVREVWEKIRRDVKAELEAVHALSENEQQKMLMETQDKLVAKRSMVLDDLTEMSGCLRRWEIEREFQSKLIAEVRLLREKLKAAEERLQEQRRQMNDMGPRVTRTHEKINHGRRECYKLSRICQGLGAQIVGEDYKVPTAGSRLLSERLKEVAVHTRQLSKKKCIPARSWLTEARDEISLSPTTSIETMSESWTTALPKSVDHDDMTSASMSDTGHDDDDGATRDSLVASIVESNITMNNREFEESTEAPLPNFVLHKMNPPEESNEASINEISCSKNNNEEESSVIEINPPEKELGEKEELITIEKENHENDKPVMVESSLPEKEDYKVENETRASSSIRANSPPNETQVSGSFELNIPRKDVKSRLVDIGQVRDSIETVDTRTSLESHVLSIAPNFTSDPQADDFSVVAAISRSDSPPFRLLTDVPSTSKRKHGRYNSVLTHFKIPRNVDPNGVLCPYELMGTCNDEDCQYYHLDPDRCCQ